MGKFGKEDKKIDKLSSGWEETGEPLEALFSVKLHKCLCCRNSV